MEGLWGCLFVFTIRVYLLMPLKNVKDMGACTNIVVGRLNFIEAHVAYSCSFSFLIANTILPNLCVIYSTGNGRRKRNGQLMSTNLFKV